MALEKDVNGLLLFKEKLKSQFDLSSRAKDRTYIIPTPFGLIFGLLVLAILMMALGYANNLLYFLVFYLISVSISAMVATNLNIDRVRIVECQVGHAFALEKNLIYVLLRNKTKSRSQLIELKCGEDSISGVSLGGFEEKSIEVPWTPKSRGLQNLPVVKMQSRFPFGFLTSWKVKREKATVLIYPARKGKTDLPNFDGANQNTGDLGLFRDLREFQTSDSPRRIDWRASTKHQEILVKAYEGLTQRSYQFEWDQTQDIVGFEDRISQLCLWIYNAEKFGHAYSLQVGSFFSEMGQGQAHMAKCLEHLALLTRDSAN